MKKSSFALLFSTFVLASCDVFALTEYYWKGTSACWTNSLWSATSSGSPIADFYPGVQAGERANFIGGSQYVTVPEGDFGTLANISVNLNSGVGKVFTFDGRDSVFRLAASDVDNWTSAPFSINYYGNHFFNLQLYTVTDLKYRRALLTVTNGLMTAVIPQSNAMSIDFRDGIWNFYDPVPDQTPTKEVCLVFFDVSQRYASAFVDGVNGAKMRFPSLYIRGNSLSNDFTIAGGSHEIMGNLKFPHNNCNARRTDTRFTVTSNALLHVDGITTFGYVDKYYNTSNRVYRFLVDKNAKAEFKGQFYTREVCELELMARDGGKLVFGAGANTVHYLGGVNLVTARVDVVDAGIDMVDTFVLGGGYNSGIVADPLAYASLYASNSVINTGAGAEGTRRLYVVNGDVEVHDSEWTSRNLYLGYAGCRARVAIKSGRFDHAGELMLACKAGSDAELSFEGGESVMTPLAAADFQLGAASGSEGVVRISGGKLNFDLSVAGNSCIIGYQQNSTGIVYQSGGDFVVSGAGGLTVGYSGIGIYEMQGGTLTTDQIRMGLAYHKRGEHLFRQSGGFVDVRSSGKYYGINVCDDTSLCRLVLDGGVMRCNSIRGWNGSTHKGTGGTGWAVLEADGGTLVASEDSAVQVQDFDEAWLGAKGLTIESDYAVTIAQAFADKEGESGLLALTGNGVKTLSATNSVQSRLTATGGIVKFAQTGGVNASHRSGAVFAGGSGVSLEGAQTEAVFRSLALGDATSFARIVLDIGDVVRSESAITALTHVKVVFSDTPAVGTYAVLRCKGAVSDAVRYNWIGRSEFLSSKPDGAGVSFTVTYDSEADETVFSVVFSAYSSEDIPDDVVSASTNISGMVTADVLRLDGSGGGKLIGGDGILELSDCGVDSIVVESGHHEIASALALPCGTMAGAVIAEGASLDITGTVLRGGIEKTGLGLLGLSAHNALGIGFVHNGGTSVLKYGDSAGSEAITVRDGTLAFAQEEGEMRLAAPLKISPSVSPTNAVVLRTDSDTVIGMVSADGNTGALIKRGAGRLTIEEDGFLLPVNSCGYSGLNQRYFSSLELVFPDSGAVPTLFPYAGINVVEGELLFKGTAECVPERGKSNSFKGLIPVAVGLNVRGVDAPAGMVLDRAVCEFNVGARHLNVGSGISEAVYGDGGDPYLLVTNDSSLIVNTLNFAWDSTHPSVKPRLEVDSSTVTCSYMFQPNRSPKVPLEHVFRNGSALFGNITFECESTVIFDGSVYAKDSALTPGRVYQEWGNACRDLAKGTLVFRNGGRFYCNAIAASVNPSYEVKHDLTVRFDDGEWIPAQTNYVCSGAIVGNPDKLVLEALGTGLVMAPGEGLTWVLDVPLTGEGGLVKRGKGVLELAQSAVRYSGLTKVEEGTLSLGAKTLSGMVIAGPGTVDDGVLADSAIRVDVDDDFMSGETPFFGDSLAFSGSFPAVDLGRTAENPLPRPFRRFAVARYDAEGEAPASGVCRIFNSGHKSMRGKIECEDGVVYVTPYLPGFSVLLR